MAILKSLGYNLYFGNSAFNSLKAFLTKNKYSSYFILCDENTLQHCLPTLISSCPALATSNIIEIESGEHSKSIDICTHIWQTLTDNFADRNTLFINLGGGVVSDLGGFCASTYKRGIDFIHIPTSLLAMADASVGGKTGIDFNGIKNLIGTFSQPKAVFVHPDFLFTLPKRHVNNGLAEIFKIALVADKNLWLQLQSPSAFKKPEQLILKSIALKNNIVLKDPFDKALRKVLNFGHTIGHAIESHYLGSPEELLHGEAILCGMVIESHLAWQKKLLSKSELDTICKTLIRRCPNVNLPLQPILQLMQNDKKNKNQQVLFALIKKTGNATYNVPASAKQIEASVLFFNSLVK
ncbi:MAG: 3-dehydroquinate synthase [Bacteroidia bacterium]|nr:3-dehydroquinate synthase [Bacteroidia bacterium]